MKNKSVKYYEFKSYIYILNIINDEIISAPSKLIETAETFIKELQKDVRRK